MLCSCVHVELSDCPPYSDEECDSTEVMKVIPVEFSIGGRDSTTTRSSITASETAVKDINLFAYYNGTLEKSVHIDSPISFTLELVRDRGYNLYALANTGKIEGPHSEEEILNLRYDIDDISQLGGGFPMSWSMTGFIPSGLQPKEEIQLQRLVSRIHFSIDKSQLENFKVSAIRLRQGSLSVAPFSTESKAQDRTQIGDGDWASSEDLSLINSGRPVTFYAMENCQGILLPENADPSQKNPQSLATSSDLCTYLEMTASYRGDYEGVEVSSDRVIYRFYLGGDSCTDFSLRRNEDINVNLTVTKERIFDDSWKVNYGNTLPKVEYKIETQQSSGTIKVGETATLSVKQHKYVAGSLQSTTDVTEYAEWSSSNTDVATITNGIIKAVGPGRATISVTFNGSISTTTITVTDNITYGIALNKSNLDLVQGSSESLSVSYITYTNGVVTKTSSVTSLTTWKSSATSVAKVSLGKITAVAEGSATITATYKGYEATCNVNVTKKPVEYTYGLEVKTDNTTIGVGTSMKATAYYITYADGVESSREDATADASWSSSSSSRATVEEGVILGKSAGTVKITATYKDTEASVNLTVQNVTTEELRMTLPKTTLNVGESMSADVEYVSYKNGVEQSSTNINYTATWKSSDATIASVSYGTIKALKAGEVTITASYNGYSTSQSVKVNDNTTSDLIIEPSAVSLTKGSTAKVKATLRTFRNGSVISSEDVSTKCTWSIGNSTIASVNSSGTVTGVTSGTTTVTATYQDMSAAADVTVSSLPSYELVLDPASLTISKGEKGSFKAIYRMYVDGELKSSMDVTSSATWSTSSSLTASVQGGTVTGSSVGSATITAKYNGYSVKGTVTVNSLEKITLEWTEATIEKGSTKTLKAEYFDGTRTTDVTSSANWTSSQTGVATVSRGTITARAEGTATITVSYRNATATCTVTVVKAEEKPYVLMMSAMSTWNSSTGLNDLVLEITMSDHTVITNVPYTWEITYTQSSNLKVGQTGEGPLSFPNTGISYTTMLKLTTKESYLDNRGNLAPLTRETSINHNLSWKP